MASDIIQYLKDIDKDFSGILSVAVALITAIITISIVSLTRRQVELSKKSIEALEKQFRLNCQPCVIPTIIDTVGSACFTDSNRRQLHINIRLKNVGNAPAINVLSIGYLKLNHTTVKGSDVIDMDFLPDYTACLNQQEEDQVSIRFEAREIKHLIEDLKVNMSLNWERLQKNPSKAHYPGTDLVIKVYYKNLLGQWFESSITKEICWLINTSKDAPERVTNNINENTIPPKELLPEMSFRLQLVSDRMSPMNVIISAPEDIKKIIDRYEDDLRNFGEVLGIN